MEENKSVRQWLKANKNKLLGGFFGLCLLVLILVMAIHLLRPQPDAPAAAAKRPEGCSDVYYRKGSALYRAYPTEKPQKLASSLGYNAPLVKAVGTTLYYLDNIAFDGSGSLYRRSLENTKEKPERMDTEVTDFSVSQDGSFLVYAKGEDLYCHDLQERRLISRDISYYCLSADHTRGLLLDSDKTLWQWTRGEELVRLEEDVTSVVCYAQDLQWSYYRCQDALYRLEWGSTPIQVSSNVCSVLKTYPDGSLYYMKESLRRINTLDMIREDGENLRMWNMLAGEKMSFYTYSLYYHQGEQSTLVAEDLSAPAQTPEGDTPVAVYRVCDMEAVEKISLSQVTYVSQVQILILQALHQASQSYVCVGSQSTQVDAYEMSSPLLSENGQWLYYLDDRGQEASDLYRLPLERLETAVAELVDSQVHPSYELVGEDAVVYFRDAQTTGALYYNGKLLGQRVPVEGGMAVCQTTGEIAYLRDWEEVSASGNLVCYSDGKVHTIASNVHTMYYLPQGHLLYLCDYDAELQLGKLYYYDGKTVTQLDTQVSQLVILP